MEHINNLSEKLGIADMDAKLLVEALTHSSYLNDFPSASDNERLEFLGDAVLSLLCSEMLYKRYPHFREGQLSRLRASLVCEETLADIAEQFLLARYLRLGKSAAGSKGYHQPSILSGTVEALLGATYTSFGYVRASELFERLYRDILSRADEDWSNPDAKSALQEMAPESVEYQVISETGPDHDRWFKVEVRVNGKPMGQGEGRSKKKAEQVAARAALKTLSPK